MEELLTQCYHNNDDIKINLELSKNIDLNDIFTIVFLVNRGSKLILDNDILELVCTEFIEIDENDNQYPCLDLDEKIKNPQIIVMLYIIYRGDDKYYPILRHSGVINRITYTDKKEFVKLAEFAFIINYPKIRHIMSIFDIDYKSKTVNVELFVQHHLGIINNNTR